MKFTRMNGPFGAIVEDFDIASQTNDETMRQLIAALYDHQILAIRGQQDMSDADYLRFGQYWGKPLKFFITSHVKNDHPEIIRIGNDPKTPERLRDEAMHWHSDSSYEPIPAAVTMLRGIETPTVGGETHVASNRLAYEALDAETKARVDGATALHCLGGSPELPGEKIPLHPASIAFNGIQKHPLVIRHPVTGTKALFPSGTAFGIDSEEDREESRELIGKLRAHATQPQFVTTYKVMPGDVFIWDNFQTMHTATALKYSDADGERRMIHRISTKGIPEMCSAHPQGHYPLPPA